MRTCAHSDAGLASAVYTYMSSRSCQTFRAALLDGGLTITLLFCWGRFELDVLLIVSVSPF